MFSAVTATSTLLAVCVSIGPCLISVAIASSGVDDVRTVLDHYKSIGGKDVLESFKCEL